ncbi:MAG TPA: dihydrofolate reductase family protein [Herpetosiphonaceae bacterium]
MPQVQVFNQVSLDGYFVDAQGDMGWAHATDPEWTTFSSENARGGGRLLFGRATYELMASFWPTPAAHAQLPVVADHMNALPKFVVSRTLTAASWHNTTLLTGDLATEVTRLKRAPGPDLVVMGSGSLVAQLTQAGLIDTYQLVVVPIVLGAGRSLFAGVTERPRLRCTATRTFANGNVLLSYEPVA